MNIVSRIACRLPLSALALALVGAPARAEPPKLPVPAVDQSAVGAARLFLCRRKICRRARQGDHAGPGLCRGAGAEGRAPALSAGADPWRRADRNQLDGNAGRTQGMGRVFRRAGLRGLHDRPADARPLRLASRRRRDPDVHRRRTRSSSSLRSRPTAPGRRQRSTRNGRARGQTRERRAIRSSTPSTPRRSRPWSPTRKPNSATRMQAPRCSTRSDPRSC